MSKVGIESFPREQACRRCQKLGFDNIFASLDDKETHGKLHLGVDYELATENPSLSIELIRQILDSCFPRLEVQKENTEASPTEGARDAILIPKEEPMETAQPEKPMEIQNEVPSGSSQLDHEEKLILDECLLCGVRCLQSERLEEHWSHVALEHLETPGIFGCSQCQRTWDTTKPFGEHLLFHHPGQQASLLDRRDQGACNIFQMCFGMSEERLAAAGLAHLFQTPMEQKAPASEPQPIVPRSQDKQLEQLQRQKETTIGKEKDRCIRCDQEWVIGRSRAEYRWKHLATCHLDRPLLFVSPVCQKGWNWTNNFKRHVSVNHPDKSCRMEDKRTDEDLELYRMCFGGIHKPSIRTTPECSIREHSSRKRSIPERSPSPPPKCSKRTKYKLSCSLCHHDVPRCFPRAQEYHLRWLHVSKKHAGGRPLYHCPLCNNSSNYQVNVLNFCKKNHPDKKALVDNKKEMKELYQRCFLIKTG